MAEPSAEAVPEAAVRTVGAVLASGRLFRYGQEGGALSQASLLEREFARMIGARGALALNSCTSAIYLALVALGVDRDRDVLIPAFTFTAVPSAVAQAGARAVLVECDETLCMDPADLAARISTDTAAVVASHMRGRIANLDEVARVCGEHGVPLIEDCAHSLGASWAQKPTGRFGQVGCFSFQSHKIVNAGEGGMLVCDDARTLARATVLSGAYEGFWREHEVAHTAAAECQGRLPTFNLRMSEVTAAIARAQLPAVAQRAARYRRNYEALRGALSGARAIELVPDLPPARRCPDTAQFRLPAASARELLAFRDALRSHGLPVTVLGHDSDNARCFWNWRYLGDTPELPRTRQILAGVCDLRLPWSLRPEHMEELGAWLAEEAERIFESRPVAQPQWA